MLLPRTYIATNYFTAADTVFYGYLHPVLVRHSCVASGKLSQPRFESKSQLQPSQRYSIPCVSRYFDHIQNQDFIRTAAAPFAPAFDLIQFTFEDAPAVERRKESFKKKEKKALITPSSESASASVPAPTVLDPAAPTPPAPAPPTAPSTPISAAVDVPAPESALQERVQKEKKKDSREEGEKKNKGGKAEETGGEPAPSMIDLRVGRIVDGGNIVLVNRMFTDFVASCQASRRRRPLHRGMRTVIDIVSADI